jgi:hypothetical protein
VRCVCFVFHFIPFSEQHARDHAVGAVFASHFIQRAARARSCCTSALCLLRISFHSIERAALARSIIFGALCLLRISFSEQHTRAIIFGALCQLRISFHSILRAALARSIIFGALCLLRISCISFHSASGIRAIDHIRRAVSALHFIRISFTRTRNHAALFRFALYHSG